MTWRNKGAAILSVFLYAQGLLGFAAVSTAILRNADWPSFGHHAASGYGIDVPAERTVLASN